MPKLIKLDGVENLYRHRDTGIYYVRKFVTGKGELYRSTRTTDRREAVYRMQEMFIEWGEGKIITRRRINLEDVAKQCLEYYRGKAPRTLESFETTWELHLRPFFHNTPIDEVAKGWPKYRIMQKRLNPKRKLQHDRRHLRFILGWAADMELLDGVPRLQLDKSDRTAKAGRELTNDEIDALLSNANDKLRLKLALKIRHGLRESDARTLRYDYIDFENGVVTIPEHIEKRRIQRRFALDADILEELRIRRESSESPYVFPHRHDPNRHETRNDHAWQRLKRSLGIDVKGHWTRYTAATRMIRAGKPNALIQVSLGMSEKVLKGIYYSPSTEDIRGLSTVVGHTLKKKK